MDFPEKIHVELIPSAELEKLRLEISAVDARGVSRHDATMKLYYEVLNVLADVKKHLEKLETRMEE